MNKQLIRLRINGQTHELAIYPNRSLLEVLREEIGLTGTKCGCDDSSCGCCTVLVNGGPMLSCVMLAASYQDAEITTIEGVARDGQLDPLQLGFCEAGGAQCGFCTPGMILAARALLEVIPNPSHEEINQALGGNLCRCTGYTQILESIDRAIQLMSIHREAAVGFTLKVSP